MHRNSDNALSSPARWSIAAALLLAAVGVPLLAVAGPGLLPWRGTASDAATARFTVQGVDCAGCAERVQAELTGIRGVQRATVSPETGIAEVVFTAPTDDGALLGAIRGLGFKARRAPLVATAPPEAHLDCGAGSTARYAPTYDVDPKRAEVCQACGGEVPADVEVGAQPNSAEGTYVRCPVSSVIFEVEPYRPAVEYLGDTYRFCCAGCAKMFVADPAHFVRGECVAAAELPGAP